jgi:hypothetical protein
LCDVEHEESCHKKFEASMWFESKSSRVSERCFTVT